MLDHLRAKGKCVEQDGKLELFYNGAQVNPAASPAMLRMKDSEKMLAVWKPYVSLGDIHSRVHR